jgi:hypothetical protein
MFPLAHLAAIPAIAAFSLLPASVGVGIGAEPVCLGTVAQPGHSYPLGNVYVVNTGSGGESVTLRAEAPFNGLKGQHFPPSWVSAAYPELLGVIGQDHLSLTAGGSAYVPLTLAVPAGARPGGYAADLVAGTVSAPSPGGGGQAVFGAGAETNLEFTVGPGGKPPSCPQDPSVTPDPKVPASAYSPVSQASGHASGGTVLIGAVIAAALLALVFRRRTGKVA